MQVIGDGTEVSHLWERDCSLQRRRQKIVEIAPAPTLDPVVRDRLLDAALRLTGAVNYKNLCTVEFLVDADTAEFFFIEANPRLQVEHTVTEEVSGLNLVELQLQIAGGQTLAELGLRKDEVPTPRGIAVQLRVNTETMQADGEAKPGGGPLSAFEPPSSRDIRVDSYSYAGYRTNPAYDSLLAKLIVHTASKSLPDAMTKAYRALCEFHVAGAPTNIPFLQALLREDAVKEGRTDTDFIGANAARLVEADHAAHPHLYFAPTTESGGRSGRAGVKVDNVDPLAVLAFGQSDARQGAAARAAAEENLAEGMVAVRTPLQSTIISVTISEGDVVPRGAQLAVMEAMKMEHEIKAETAGIVRAIHAEAGDTMWEEQLLIALEPSDAAGDTAMAEEEIDPDYICPDLAEVLERKSLIYDENRPQAAARRRKTGHRTVRENVNDLVHPDTFIEYGPMVVAAQVRRRGIEDLRTRSSADGIIVGVGQVNEDLFGDPASRVVVLAYDYTVFAGTQGVHNHWKTDKGIDLADDGRMPVILFAEGGGGRPGDDDYGGFIGFDTFHHFMKLSGHVPIVCIVAGRCYAGNASLVGVFAPEDIGPSDVQSKNGVIDILVENEAEAVQVAKKYVSYFQGPLKNWTASDQRRMRHIVPENRLRIYEICDVIETLADEDSVLELRKDFGRTIVTCLVRLEGRAVGVIANDPKHLGGAIDSDGSDKGARLMQLCDAYDIPIVHLCDTPGIMVGPEIEKTALVRHAARMFVNSANLTVPYCTIITRKAYGLGQSAMAGGNLRFPYFYVAWPTGEFAPPWASKAR